MAHRIAPRRRPALRNIAAGLALIVAPVLLYLGVGGQAAQAATNPDWTLQANGTTVCTTFTAFSWGTHSIPSPPGTPPGPTPTVTVGVLSGGSATCSVPLFGLKDKPVPETFTVFREICNGGTPEEIHYVFDGASVVALQLTEGLSPTVEAQFTFTKVAITYPKLGGSC
jgi:hypothetical protein